MATTLRYEVWTLPWDSGGFSRVIADLPVPEGDGSGSIRLSDFGDGSVKVPVMFSRINSVISSTTGSLIRVYDGDILIHEYMAERVTYPASDPDGDVSVSGRGIEAGFDQAIIYPWDYDNQPTKAPNWVWGGPNILENPSFEDNQVVGLIDDVHLGPEAYELYTTATGGTFTLTPIATPTSAIDYDASSSAVASALEALAGITNVNVNPKNEFADPDTDPVGTVNNPWVIEFIEPTLLSGGQMTVDGTNLTGGTATLTNTLDPSTTFTLSIQGETTASINWNDSLATIESKIQALSGITDVLVTGDGRSDSPWNIKFVDPEDPNGPLTGTGTGLTIVQVQTGKSDLVAGWTKSQRADQRSEPAYHGTYSIFRQSSGGEPVQDGSFSLVVAGTQYAGGQQIVSVKPGALYWASGRVRTNASNQTFRLVMRDIYEEIINVYDTEPPWSDARDEVTPVADTWTEMRIEDILAETYQFGFDRDKIVFRFANVTSSASGIWYFDNMVLSEGFPPAEIGKIVRMLMADAVVDHAADPRGIILDWVDYLALNAVNDSSGTAWTRQESFTAFRGATYGQTFDRIRSLGYEWRLVPKVTPVGGLTHTLEFYERGNMGTNYSTSATPSITLGQGVRDAQVTKRIPDRSAVLIEGNEGQWVEDKNATLETNFGRFEKYRGDTGLNDLVTLGAAADELLAEGEDVRETVSVTAVATLKHPRPFIDYNIGDVVNVQIPPYLPKTAKRISQITYRNTEPTTYTIDLVTP